MQRYHEQKEFQNLSSIVAESENEDEERLDSASEPPTSSQAEVEDEERLDSSNEPPISSQPEVEDEEKVILPQYEKLYEQNNDFIGWVTIPNTKIDFPVMFTPAEPEYYLHRAFDKTNSLSGTPFIGAGGTVDSDCLIIYGHNMKNNTMFGELNHYRDRSFWEQNHTFTFNTIYEHREYEIFAILKTRVLNIGEEGFRYYNASGELTEEKYAELTNWLIENSIYDTGVIPVNGEQILMLSTCSYHTDNGRFVVAARRKSLPNQPTDFIKDRAIVDTP